MYKKPTMNTGADAICASELGSNSENTTVHKKWEDHGKIRNKYYDICNNCGKHGHAFKQCKNPITSFGVIIFRINQNQRQYLMIRRKDTLGYIDFMRGKYSVTNHKYILNMLKQMTVSEKHKLSTFTFNNLWNELWSGDRITNNSEKPAIEPKSGASEACIGLSSEEAFWQGGLPASFTTNSVGDNVAGRVCPLPHCPTDTINNSYRQEETNSRDKFLYLSTKYISNCSQTSKVSVPNSSGDKDAYRVSSEEAFSPLPKSSANFACSGVSSEGGWKPPLPNYSCGHQERRPKSSANFACSGLSSEEAFCPLPPEEFAPCQTILQYLLMVSNIPDIWKGDADPIPQEGGGWLEPEWGFPKGRRNYQEKDYECALREMTEETGYSPNNVKNIKNIIPFDEIFLGSNYKSYKHRYYLMYMNYHDSLSMDNFEKSEVSCMEWKSYDECMKSIRSYNLEKKRLITNIEQTLSKYRLFFHSNTM